MEEISANLNQLTNFKANKGGHFDNLKCLEDFPMKVMGFGLFTEIGRVYQKTFKIPFSNSSQ